MIQFFKDLPGFLFFVFVTPFVECVKTIKELRHHSWAFKA